jgi:hypothetical protein
MIWRILFYILLALGAGCGQKNEENSKVPTVIKEMQTHCIGRHLVDLPTGFELTDGATSIFKQANAPVDAPTIDVITRASGITRAEFAKKVKKRRTEIVAAADDTTDILKEMKSIGDNATLFRILQIGDAYISELHILKGDRYLSMTTDSFHNQFLEAETRLADFSKNVALDSASADSHPGFCLGPVVIQGQYVKEYATFSFRSRLQPDVLLSVDVDTYLPDEAETLLHRVSGPGSLLKKFDVRNKVLREGELKVGGMRAQEWLSWAKLGDDRDKKQFAFALETTRAKPSPAQPHIHVELATGQQDLKGDNHTNSLSDEEAISLWDSIVKSIRLRPGAID